MKGTLAPQAAGVIHTDFERGFIKVRVAFLAEFFGKLFSKGELLQAVTAPAWC